MMTVACRGRSRGSRTAHTTIGYEHAMPRRRGAGRIARARIRYSWIGRRCRASSVRTPRAVSLHESSTGAILTIRSGRKAPNEMNIDARIGRSSRATFRSKLSRSCGSCWERSRCRRLCRHHERITRGTRSGGECYDWRHAAPSTRRKSAGRPCSGSPAIGRIQRWCSRGPEQIGSNCRGLLVHRFRIFSRRRARYKCRSSDDNGRRTCKRKMRMRTSARQGRALLRRVGSLIQPAPSAGVRFYKQAR